MARPSGCRRYSPTLRKLEENRLDQIAALPLGGRVKLDPWSNRLEMMKTKPVVLLSPQEKMPFEVAPFFPYLTRVRRRSGRDCECAMNVQSFGRSATA